MNTSSLIHPLRLPSLADFAPGRSSHAPAVVPRIRPNLVLRRVVVAPEMQRDAMDPFSAGKCRFFSK